MSVFISDPQLDLSDHFLPNGTPRNPPAPNGTIVVPPPFAGTANDSLSQSFSSLATWFKTPNTETGSASGSQSIGEISAYNIAYAYSGTQNGTPGSGDTAIIMGPGTITGSGTAGTLALDGSLTISANITVSTFLAGASYIGAEYTAPLLPVSGTAARSPPPGSTVQYMPVSGSSTTTYDAATVSSPGSSGVVVTYVRPGDSGSNNGNAYSDPPVTLTPTTLTADAVTLSGTIQAQTGTLAYATLDLTGLLSFAAQDGLTLTFGSTLAVQSGGNLETSTLVMQPGEGTSLEVDTGGTLALSGGASGGNGPAGLDVEGIAAINGGTLQSPNAVIAVGTTGAGTLSLTGGASATTGYSEIGSQGTLSLSGAGVAYQSNATGSVTDNGVLTIDAGATLGVGSVTIGAESGDTGNAVVNGATLRLAGALSIGDAGTGTLALSNAATLQVGTDVEIGAQAGGSGLLTLASGATARVQGDLTAGSVAGSSGTVAIDGATTTLTVQGDTAIGEGGSGTLAITNGATLAATGAIDVGAAGTNSGVGVVTVAGSIAAGNALSVDNGSLTLGPTGMVSVSGDFSAGDAAGGTGSVTLVAGATLSDGTGITIGGQGTGTLSIAAGADVNAAGADFAVGDGAGGIGSVSITGGLLNVSSVGIGGSGTGTLDLGGGGTLSVANDVAVGDSAGGIGYVTLTGAGGIMTIGDGLTVGGAGTGEVLIDGALAAVTGGDISVGESLGAVGNLTVNTGSLTASGKLDIGTAGNGTVDLQLGASVAGFTDVSVGESAGGVGGLALDDGALTSQTLSVGGFGQATIALSAGSVLTTQGSAKIAEQATGTTQSVSIDQSAWQVTRNLTVGDAGKARVTITNGGSLSALGTLAIGGSSGAAGTVSATGSSAAVDFAALVVGDSGSGSLTLQNGAGAAPTHGQAGTIEIGAASSGSGTLTLSGGGSTLDAATLDVGGAGTTAGGSGVLAIGAGASAAVADVTVFAKGTITLSGGTLKTDPLTLDPGGTISGTGTISGNITNDGNIIAAGGTLDLTGSIGGDGSLIIGQGAVLIVAGAVAATETIAFAGNSGTLLTYDHGALDATIAPHGAGDFVTACFASGTRLATAAGDVPVEALRAGDLLATLGGTPRPLRWLGHRRIDCRRHPRPHDVWPIRIAADAFGPGRPRRTLHLSPDHAVFTGGVLIPVRYLVNGASIAQEPRDVVTYYHVELPRHDVVLAEGLPCESYLDTGNRAAFANGGVAMLLHADFARAVWARAVWARQGCAPLVTGGPLLVVQQRRLLARARSLGHRHTRAPDLHLLADGRLLRGRGRAGLHRVALPAGVATIRLRSRSAAPAWSEPASSDHRRLGVAVARIALDGIAVPLDDPRLGVGWHAMEPHWRWTDGDAALAIGGAHVLEITLAMTARYWREGRCQPRFAARSNAA